MIVGGGVIGLAAALACKQSGMETIVLEKDRCGGQASGAAAGMLAPFSEIGEDPDDFFRLCLHSLRMFPDWVDTVRRLSGESFEYTQSGSFHVAFHEADLLELESRKRWQSEFSIEAELLEEGALKRRLPLLNAAAKAALFYPEESHVYAPAYVRALKIACVREGVVLHEHCGNTTVSLSANGFVAETETGETYSGDRLVLSAGAWSAQWEKMLGIRLPVFPIRGQICSYALSPGTLGSIVFTSQGYFVQKQSGQFVCGASEDVSGFDARVTERGIRRLQMWAEKMFPFLKKERLASSWAGLRPATQDGFPLIGKVPGRHDVILATGHYRNGILLSPITAHIVCNLLQDKEPHIAISAFDPGRFT